MQTEIISPAGARTQIKALVTGLDLVEQALAKPPKPVLRAGIIYSGDNGRLICLRCAGMSAKFTGRDISGHKVTAMTQDDSMEWEKEFGCPLSCEGGCTTYRSVKQVKEAGAKFIQ